MSELAKAKDLGYGRFAGRYLQILGILELFCIPLNALMKGHLSLDASGLIDLWLGWCILQGRNGCRIAAIILCSITIAFWGLAPIAGLWRGTVDMNSTLFVPVKDPSIALVALIAVLVVGANAIPLAALLHPKTRRGFGSKLTPMREVSISLLTVVVVVGALSLLLMVADRWVRGGPTKPQVTITLDWAEWKAGAATHKYPSISLSSPYGMGAIGKTVDGRKYLGLRAYEKEGDLPRPSVFEYYYHRSGPSDTGIDLFITSKVLLQVEIVHFDQGILQNVDTGKVLEPPFILEPGEYHLEASERETAQPAGPLGELDLPGSLGRALRRPGALPNGARRTGGRG